MYSFEELLKIVEMDVAGAAFPARPAGLYDPVRYGMAAGGKRIRPVALLMACNIFTDNIAEARKAALAVETFHNFTLLHDDIMDNADTRRGMPTVHRKWSPATAILSGDAMLIWAYKILGQCNEALFPELFDIFNDFAAGVCEGQQYDMDFEAETGVSVERYLQMIRGKTAVLLAGALRMGAVCGGAPREAAELLFRFGIDLGMAFQLQDDLLDTYADPEVFGKAVGGDILEGKKTFLLTTAMSIASEAQRGRLEELVANKSIPAEERIGGVKELYDVLGVAEITALTVEGYSDSAIAALEKIKTEPARLEPLRGLARSLLDREK